MAEYFSASSQYISDCLVRLGEIHQGDLSQQSQEAIYLRHVKMVELAFLYIMCSKLTGSEVINLKVTYKGEINVPFKRYFSLRHIETINPSRLVRGSFLRTVLSLLSSSGFYVVTPICSSLCLSSRHLLVESATTLWKRIYVWTDHQYW